MAEQRTSPEQRAELRRLHAAATPGGWVAEGNRDAIVPHYTISADSAGDGGAHDGLVWVADLGREPNDAEYVVALRNAAPALLHDAEALAGALAEVARLRAAMDKARDILDGVEWRMIDAGRAAETDEDEDWWGEMVEEVRGAIAALAPDLPQNPADLPPSNVGFRPGGGAATELPATGTSGRNTKGVEG